MTPQEYLRGILKGQPIPEELWETPEILWESVPDDRDNAPHPSWTILQAMLFARKLGDVPEHIDLIGHTHPETGDSLLHGAIKWGLAQETALLITQGADPFQKNNAGETPAELGKLSTSKSIQALVEQSTRIATKEKVKKAIKQPPIQIL